LIRFSWLPDSVHFGFSASLVKSAGTVLFYSQMILQPPRYEEHVLVFVAQLTDNAVMGAVEQTRQTTSQYKRNSEPAIQSFTALRDKRLSGCI